MLKFKYFFHFVIFLIRIKFVLFSMRSNFGQLDLFQLSMLSYYVKLLLILIKDLC